jgi:putative DNA primase/helicase
MSLSLNINQLLDLETEEPEQLWGPPICTHNLVIVYGGTGTGKSYFTWKLAHSIATGSSFLNHKCGRPRKVLLVEGELGLATTKKRMKMIEAEAPISLRGDAFRVLSKDQCGGQLWNMSDPVMMRRYNAQIRDAEVIIIDNLMSAAFPMDRRDDEMAMWNRLMPWLFMVRDSGRTVIMVAHTNKAGVFAGVQTKMNLMDTVIELRVPEITRPVHGMEFELRYMKTRDVKKSEALPLHVEYIEGEDKVSRWVWRPLEDTRRSLVQQMKEEGLSKREVARQLNLSYREVNYAWDRWEVG